MMYANVSDAALDKLEFNLTGDEEQHAWDIFPEDYPFFDIDKLWDALLELATYVDNKEIKESLRFALFGTPLGSLAIVGVQTILHEKLPIAIYGLEQLNVDKLVQKVNNLWWWKRKELSWDYQDPDIVEAIKDARTQLLEFYKTAFRNQENIVLFVS